MRQPKQRQFAPQISLQKLSAKSNNLQSLIKQASTRKSLETLFNEAVPQAFRGKFQINSLESGILTLTCQSAALMTKFRFNQNQILSQLNNSLQPQRIASIKFKIRPINLATNHSKTPKEDIKQHGELSKKNAQILQEEAEHTDDINLKKVLLKLAERGS